MCAAPDRWHDSVVIGHGSTGWDKGAGDMTDNRIAPGMGFKRAGFKRHVPGTVRSMSVLSMGSLLVSFLTLGGCLQNAGPASGLRVYAADLTGAAKACEVGKVAPVAGATSDAAMKLANDGGWCAISVHQEGPKPFEAGLLTQRPDHGEVLIHEVGDETRIDYTPDHGFTGRDSFAVKLIPGGAGIRTAVTVTAKQANGEVEPAVKPASGEAGGGEAKPATKPAAVKPSGR